MRREEQCCTTARQTMSQGGSAMLGSGSQSCPVMAKTDNAQSIINILTAIHLKRDIVRHVIPFPPARGAAAAALPAGPPVQPRAVCVVRRD